MPVQKIASRKAALPFLLLCCALLTACGDSALPRLITKVEVQRQQIPDALLVCEGDPAPPVEPVAADDYAGYVVTLWSAGQDCRSKLARIRALQP